MVKTIWFASTNNNKIIEIKRFFSSHGYMIKSLLDLKKSLKIIENGTSYQENALIKAQALAEILDDDAIVIADDTGLEIEALDNFPGIYSNRWKGDMTFHQAMRLILKKLENKENKNARLVTVIVLINRKNNIIKSFFGHLDGKITKRITSDENGFGYDGFFYLPSKKITLHEMSKEEKNQISHRGKALKELLDYLMLEEVD